MAGPLTGFRVIDVSEVISGPLASMVLADQGADVIKVEPPSHGEESRQIASYRAGMAALYANCNHGKRSIGLDLKLADVRATGAELIVTTNPGCQLQLAAGVRRAGLDAEVVHLVELLDRGYGSSPAA